MQSSRRGFTLVEMLVVVAIIGILMALTLVAIAGSRARARRVQCLHRMQQVGIALREYAEVRRRLPPHGYYGNEPPWPDYHSWVLEVLPYLDRPDIHDAWNFNEPFYDDINSNNAEIAQTHVEILTCPDDPSVSGHGDQSFVVNAGFAWGIPNSLTEFTDIDAACPATAHSDGTVAHWMQGRQGFDLNGDGVRCPSETFLELDGSPRDQVIWKQTSLFFGGIWPTSLKKESSRRFHTLGSITDGLSNTILLTENVRVGYDAASDLVTTNGVSAESSWANPNIMWQCFLVSGYICEDLTCADGNVDYSRANDHSQEPYSNEAINASLDQAEGGAPWPSSYHTGAGVNIVMCGGEARFLSEDVDGAVYAALVTPQGKKVRGPLAEIIVSDQDIPD